MAIDAHQHFWRYNPERDSWITDEMAMLKQDYLPQYLQPLLQKNEVDGCVLVQSDQSKEHNDFLLQLSEENDFIKGVIGWIDLQANDIVEQLEFYSHCKKMKGFRHILQSEDDRALMLRPAFKRGIAALESFGYTYDILIYPDQLQYAASLVSAFPSQLFILDHIAKPDIKKRKISGWETGIRALGKYPNIYCKISGMVTEADWKYWQKEDFTPFINTVVESFGVERIMFGSDWPVCLVAGTYEDVIGIVEDYFSSFSARERHLFFHENAEKAYKLT